MKIYLYIKQHQTTGLKYFGKTIKDPYKYKGSGIYWRRHLKVYGEKIDTLDIWEFTDPIECEKFALDFSVKNNIVESKDWANMMPENGIGGGNGGMRKEKNPNWGKAKEQTSFYGKKHKAETIELYKKQKSGGNNPRAKKVATPNGVFNCMKDAAKALHISRETLRSYINNNTSEYSYL